MLALHSAQIAAECVDCLCCGAEGMRRVRVKKLVHFVKSLRRGAAKPVSGLTLQCGHAEHGDDKPWWKVSARGVGPDSEYALVRRGPAPCGGRGSAGVLGRSLAEASRGLRGPSRRRRQASRPVPVQRPEVPPQCLAVPVPRPAGQQRPQSRE